MLTVALAMVGKFCITAAYSTTYIHTAEIFPTVVRNAGLGGASVFARIGTMIAPYIVVAVCRSCILLSVEFETERYSLHTL